jgi:hypothetical protein
MKVITPESLNLSGLSSVPLTNRKQLLPILDIYFAIDSLESCVSSKGEKAL